MVLSHLNWCCTFWFHFFQHQLRKIFWRLCGGDERRAEMVERSSTAYKFAAGAGVAAASARDPYLMYHKHLKIRSQWGAHSKCILQSMSWLAKECQTSDDILLLLSGSSKWEHGAANCYTTEPHRGWRTRIGKVVISSPHTWAPIIAYRRSPLMGNLT